MTTDTRSTPRTTSPRRVRRMVMLVNGTFLTAVGAAQVTFELLSHYAGAGPLGAVFDGSPYTIGWVEDHGFALLVGVLFLTVGANDSQTVLARLPGLAVHILLGHRERDVLGDSLRRLRRGADGTCGDGCPRTVRRGSAPCLVASRPASQAAR